MFFVMSLFVNRKLPLYLKRSICAFILLSCLLNVAAVSLYAKAKKKKIDTSLEWLKLPKETLLYWKVAKVEDKPNYIRISPRWPNKNKSIPKNIFGLMSKKSKSYKLAVIKLLEVLVYEELYAFVTLANFSKSEEIGRQAITYAQNNNIDIIYSMGSETASLVYRLYTGGKIPVVASICKDPVLLGQVKDYKSGTKTNIAFTSLNIPLDIKLNYLTQLKPNLQNIGLMYDKNHKQVMQVEVVPAKKAFKKSGIHIVDIAVADRETASTTLEQRIPLAIKEMRKTDPSLKNSVFWITSSTAVFANIRTINKFSGTVPVLSSIPNVVSEGNDSAVLAIGVDRRNNAHLASLYVVRILRGEVRAGDLPVGVITPPDIAINFSVASKIGLKIPFRFFESASFIYDYKGKVVRAFGKKVKKESKSVKAKKISIGSVK